MCASKCDLPSGGTIREMIDNELRRNIENANRDELWVALVDDPSHHGRIIAVDHESEDPLLVQWDTFAAWYNGKQVKRIKP